MTNYDDKTLEQFLLGELSDSEREEIEQQFFANDELFSRLEELEVDLIDSYVRGMMSDDQHARFEAALDAYPARAARIVFARTLADGLDSHRQAPDNVAPFTRRLVPVITALAAAAVIFAIAIPSLLEPNGSIEPEASQVVTEETTAPVVSVPDEPVIEPTAEEPTEIAAKKARRPSLSAPKAVTFVLAVTATRSIDERRVLAITTETDVVNVQLAVDSDEFSTFNVEIRDGRGEHVWAGKSLKLTTIDHVPAVAFEVPSAAFHEGSHELILAGVLAGSAEEIAYLDFNVTRE